MKASPQVPIVVIAGVSSGVGKTTVTHLHFGSNPALARNFVSACATRR